MVPVYPEDVRWPFSKRSVTILPKAVALSNKANVDPLAR